MRLPLQQCVELSGNVIKIGITESHYVSISSFFLEAASLNSKDATVITILNPHLIPWASFVILCLLGNGHSNSGKLRTQISSKLDLPYSQRG